MDDIDFAGEAMDFMGIETEEDSSTDEKVGEEKGFGKKIKKILGI